MEDNKITIKTYYVEDSENVYLSTFYFDSNRNASYELIRVFIEDGTAEFFDIERIDEYDHGVISNWEIKRGEYENFDFGRSRYIKQDFEQILKCLDKSEEVVDKNNYYIITINDSKVIKGSYSMWRNYSTARLADFIISHLPSDTEVPRVMQEYIRIYQGDNYNIDELAAFATINDTIYGVFHRKTEHEDLYYTSHIKTSEEVNDIMDNTIKGKDYNKRRFKTLYLGMGNTLFYDVEFSTFIDRHILTSSFMEQQYVNWINIFCR